MPDAIGNQVLNLPDLTNSQSASTGQERVGQQALGQDDFFKLLTTQLASQDPLEPMDDTAFIAQMASFSELEMTSNLTKSFEALSKSQRFESAQGYIGKMVTFPGEEAALVTAVEFNNDEVQLFVDGKNTDGRSIDSVTKVESSDLYTKSSTANAAGVVANAVSSAKQLLNGAKELIGK